MIKKLQTMGIKKRHLYVCFIGLILYLGIPKVMIWYHLTNGTSKLWEVQRFNCKGKLQSIGFLLFNSNFTYEYPHYRNDTFFVNQKFFYNLFKYPKMQMDQENELIYHSHDSLVFINNLVQNNCSCDTTNSGRIQKFQHPELLFLKPRINEIIMYKEFQELPPEISM